MEEDKPSTLYYLEQWNQGNRKGLDALLDKHLPWLQACVRKRLGPKLREVIDSSDVVQDAAVQFLLYSPRFRISDENHFRALLARIVENVLRNHNDWFNARRRDIARRKPLPSDTILSLDPPKDGEVKTPSRMADAHENEAWVRLGIELLNAEERFILVLRNWDQLSFPEIGEKLGISEDAAWMRHSRAVDRLTKVVGNLRRGELAPILLEEVEEDGIAME